MNGSAQKEALRRVPVNFDEQMYPSSPSVLSPETFKCRALAMWPARTIVPVIFIPGIMGSNLRTIVGKNNAWRPPNSLKEKLTEVDMRKSQKPAARQTQLSAADVEVFDDPAGMVLPKGYLALNPDEAILHALEDQLNYPYQDIEYYRPTPGDKWKEIMQTSGKGWQPHTSFKPLAEAEFRARLGKTYFAVHACGYNWLESNEESAKRVIMRIREIEARLKDHKYFKYAGKVILVTHSMGGLVGRRVAKELGDKILGVVHGVQPVLGAPVVYRRFKAGTESDGWFDIVGKLTAKVMGWSAADVTCVLANSPGALELLPTKGYPKEWLHFTDGEKTVKLPRADPYSEIYATSNEKCWWGMVDPKLIDPAGEFKKKDADADPMRDGFLRNLKTAEIFHDNLGLACHPNTYAYYGDDAAQHSFHEVIWRTVQDITPFNDADILSAERTKASLLGATAAKIKGQDIHFTLDNKYQAGDGTVPTPSGAGAAKLEGVKQVFKLEGFEHGSSYKNQTAVDTVLYSIAKIAQALPLEEDVSCEVS
jgi:pimeloyl-ACP methyl ester carboxylesterase